MKKFIVIAVILMCCLVYAIVKLSISEDQNAYKQTEETQSVQQINADNTDQATPAEETQSAKQINDDNTDKATPEEGSGSAVPVVQVDVPAVQVEAITKVFGEFQSAIKNEDYEQAWMLMSEVVKSVLSFEEFTKGINVLANVIIHPESATNIEGRVRLLITSPEDELYLFFNQEDGQWKLYHVKPAQNVDTSKE
jgi:hypothetical protein